MPYQMSHASLPVFEIGLNALSGVLDKAAAFASAKKLDPAVLPQYRLAPDMFALARQVQVACDQAKNGASRLAGLSRPNTRTTRRYQVGVPCSADARIRLCLHKGRRGTFWGQTIGLYSPLIQGPRTA